jgi:hypothetical protein
MASMLLITTWLPLLFAAPVAAILGAGVGAMFGENL